MNLIREPQGILLGECWYHVVQEGYDGVHGGIPPNPAYTVAHNSTLESIAALRPSSMHELARIKGVGPAFVDRHGEAVLALVAGVGSGVGPRSGAFGL